MKIIEETGAQGDVLFTQVEELPADAQLSEATTPGAAHLEQRVVVAHSETGHHHVAKGRNITVYVTPTNPLDRYLVTESDIDVVHERNFDTHEPLRLAAKKDKPPTSKTGKKTVWRARRQRETGPEGSRPVGD